LHAIAFYEQGNVLYGINRNYVKLSV
jgi:hypothetical protein